MSISRKVFLVFAALFAVTAVLGAMVALGVRGMQHSAAEVGAIRQFQLRLQRLEPFEQGREPVTDAQRREFDRRWDDARAAAETLRAVDPELAPALRRGLDAVVEQLEFFRAGVLEMVERQANNDRLHLGNHALAERLAAGLPSLSLAQREVRATTMARVETAWASAYHDRSPAAVGELRRLLAAAQSSWEDVESLKLLAGFVANAEQSYLNHLAAREGEAMLADTAARLNQVADAAIAAAQAANRREYLQLNRAVGGTVAAALVLTLFLWLWSTRYLRRFLESTRGVVDQVRAGRYRVSVEAAPADEFGDLTRFLGKVAADLGDTVVQLGKSQERYRRLVEELVDWVWETDAAGLFSYSSPAGTKILGLTAGEVTELALETVLGGDRPLPAWAEDGYLSRWRRPDGTERVLESRWEPQEGEGGGVRGITRDVTDRVHAEVEQTRLQEQLVHAQKMEAVGTLSGGVAHDFNNLLQSIGGYAELLLRNHGEDAAVAGSLHKILGATGRAARLTEQLLVFGRRDPGQPRPVDVNAEVEQAVELLSSTIPKMIEIRRELSAELPLALVDPLQLEQVVVNLALNARDAMPRGGELLLRTAVRRAGPGSPSTQPDLAPGEYVCLQVSDTGEGMTAGVKARVFEPFFTTKEVGKGTGLGLAMVYGIAQGHGGAVACRSKVGLGSTFSVYLPVAPVGRLSPGEPDPTELALPEIDGCGGTVLLVDDEPWVRELGVEILTGGGYTTLEADSGEAALECYRARGGAVDLVVLDLNMPGMGGEECYRQLLEADPELSILIATGHLAIPGEDTRGLERARGWIRKPYRVQGLLAEVRRVLQE